MEYQNILLDIKDGIARITFNRPKVLNAMSFEVMTELAHALKDCDQDDCGEGADLDRGG